MKEKEYEISIKVVKENIIKVSASSQEEALKSAEEIAMAPNYEKVNNTKKSKDSYELKAWINDVLLKLEFHRIFHFPNCAQSFRPPFHLILFSFHSFCT